MSARPTFTPSSAMLIAQADELAQSITSSLRNLARDPKPDRCELLAAKGKGLESFALTLRRSLIRESQGDMDSA